MLYFYKDQFVPYDRTLEIYFIGCSKRCLNCQNPELWEIDTSTKVPVSYIMDRLIEYKDISKQVHILGGEPLEQDITDIQYLPYKLKEIGFTCPIILFTGYTNEELELFLEKNPNTLDGYDFIKTGEYDETLIDESDIKDPMTGIHLITSNQKFYLIEKNKLYPTYEKKVEEPKKEGFFSKLFKKIFHK